MLTTNGYGCSHTALNYPENIHPVCTFPLEAGIVAHLRAEQVRDRGSIVVRDKRFFSSPDHLQGLWGHPDSNLIDAGGSFSGRSKKLTLE